MKEKKEIVKVLNSLLSDDLNTISQYMLHPEININGGDVKLQLGFKKQAVDEMHNTEWLIQRIIFIAGSPLVTKQNTIKIGKSVSDMSHHLSVVEHNATCDDSDSVKIAREAYEQGTTNLLSRILKTEENDINWAEIQRTQIDQMGMENYLLEHTE